MILDKLKAYGWMAAAIAVGVFAGVQTLRLHTAQLDAAQTRIAQADTLRKIADLTAAAERAVRAEEALFNTKLNEARNAAKIRETKLAADAGLARSQSDGLRDELAAIRFSLPALARDAVNRYADTASIVFAECVRSYSALAETADRIDSDRQTLIDGWPK